MNDFLARWKAIYEYLLSWFGHEKKPVVEPPKPLKTKGLRAEIEQRLEELDPEIFSKYKPSDGLWVELGVAWPSIETLSRKIRYISGVVSKEEEVPKNWYPEEIINISMDRFLLNEKGQYPDRVAIVTSFKEAGLSLCRAMKPCDDAAFGVYEYNNRMLLRLMLSLKTIVEGLDFKS